MERITWKRNLDGYEDVGLNDTVTVDDAICQLADYEDTGMNPKEIKEWLEDAESRFILWLNKRWGMSAGRFITIMNAEQESRIVLLPPNEAPLTYEALRQMDGEVVWAEKIRRRVFVSVWKDRVTLVDSDDFCYTVKMAGPAYRYPFEKEKFQFDAPLRACLKNKSCTKGKRVV